MSGLPAEVQGLSGSFPGASCLHLCPRETSLGFTGTVMQNMASLNSFNVLLNQFTQISNCKYNKDNRSSCLFNIFHFQIYH